MDEDDVRQDISIVVENAIRRTRPEYGTWPYPGVEGAIAQCAIHMSSNETEYESIKDYLLSLKWSNGWGWKDIRVFLINSIMEALDDEVPIMYE